MSRPARKSAGEWRRDWSAGLSYHWNSFKYSIVASCTSTIASREILSHTPSGEDLLFFSYFIPFPWRGVGAFFRLSSSSRPHPSLICLLWISRICVEFLFDFKIDWVTMIVDDCTSFSAKISPFSSMLSMQYHFRDAATILGGSLRSVWFFSLGYRDGLRGADRNGSILRLGSIFPNLAGLGSDETEDKLVPFPSVTVVVDKQAMCSPISKPFSIFDRRKRAFRVLLTIFLSF